MTENKDEKTSLVQLVIDLMMQLTDEQRMDVMNSFCKHCGCDNKYCSCWNDE